MKIQTYSVLVGSEACNAHCPYCVSKMTPSQGMGRGIIKPNWRNFDVGCRFAKDNNVSTVLLTGKGEPALFPEQVTEFMERLQPFGFPFIELQTNGILFSQQAERYNNYLREWYRLGLTTIAVSIVHHNHEKNEEIFRPRGFYQDTRLLILQLHSFGFSVRLSCVMFRGGIDSPEEVGELIRFAKASGAEQLSIRPVKAPKVTKDREAARWVAEHKLEDGQLSDIKAFLEAGGVELMKLVHGAVVYDVFGQNVCLTNALTLEPFSEDVRQLIFFPDGHLRYDWQHPGAILL